MIEHLPCTQGVNGLSPLSSTIISTVPLKSTSRKRESTIIRYGHQRVVLGGSQPQISTKFDVVNSCKAAFLRAKFFDILESNLVEGFPPGGAGDEKVVVKCVINYTAFKANKGAWWMPRH